MNEKKFTTAKDDIGSTGVPIWNEHIFFEPKNVVREFTALKSFSLVCGLDRSCKDFY